MAITTLKQKISLFFLGVFLSFVLLEIGLRVGGFVFVLLQEKGNKVTFSDQEIRILCVGESTTALGRENSYPSQLETLLNSRQSQKTFKVINKGLVSKTSEDILAQLEENLNKYRPHLVVSMMGINDRPPSSLGSDTFKTRAKMVLQKFRVYQFFSLLRMHLREKGKELREKKNVLPGEPEDILLSRDEHPDPEELKRLVKMGAAGNVFFRRLLESLKQNLPDKEEKKIKNRLKSLKVRQGWILIRIGRYYRLRRDYDRAVKYLKDAARMNPGNYAVYVELGRCSLEQKQYRRAVAFLKKARALRPDSALAAYELHRTYGLAGDEKGALELARWLLDREFDNIWYYSSLGEWLLGHGYFQDAERTFQIASRRNPTDYHLLEDLARVYEAQGKTQQARAFYQKARKVEERAERYWPVTVRCYNKMAEILSMRKIPLICMQYPRRDIEPLKKIFWGNFSLIFVENRENFEKNLEDDQYSKYFSDHFAGLFGHCTRKGNYLIADNLADVILDEFSLRTKAR